MTVFATTRVPRPAAAPDAAWPLPLNQRNQFNGLDLLAALEAETIPLCIFDPQYRGILDKMQYGNEGVSRGRARSSLPQMSEETIARFLEGIARVLIPSGHLFLWVDKFHICTGVEPWLTQCGLEVVDLVTWNKGKMGMGYRTRRFAEYLVIAQKPPKRAKGVWHRHDIPDVWVETVDDRHAHAKPMLLQAALIDAVTYPEDVILDPAAGSYSSLNAGVMAGRKFLGCDLEPSSGKGDELMPTIANAQRASRARKDGGYTRLFDSPQIGAMISQIQSTVISAGTELEEAIQRHANNLLPDVDVFLSPIVDRTEFEGVFLADKKAVRKSQTINATYRPDFLVFDRSAANRNCYVVELKDGDTFDTKKADGEITALTSFVDEVSGRIPYSLQIRVCSFNQTDKTAIVDGFKGRVDISQVWTGGEFCQLLGIDYQTILDERKAYAEANREWLVTSVLDIPELRAIVEQKIGEYQA